MISEANGYPRHATNPEPVPVESGTPPKVIFLQKNAFYLFSNRFSTFLKLFLQMAIVKVNARFSTLNVHLLLQTCVYFVNSPAFQKQTVTDDNGR